MLEHLDLTKVLCLDIETVPAYPDYEKVPSQWKELWNRKISTQSQYEGKDPSETYNRAGIYAEFGKIICICVGYFQRNGNEYSFRMKSFYGDDERTLLEAFSSMLDKLYGYSLCAHNGKEFDFPFISRRCLVNDIPIPKILDVSGKKPWEVSFLDTMELWKFGDYKSFTSLNLLATLFDIPTPKDDIDGSEVWKVYWLENNLERIRNYCRKDVVTVARLLLKYTGGPALTDDNIIHADD